MEDYRNLNHTKWQCKYRIVFIPKYRRKKLYGAIKRKLGEAFHRLAQQKECWIEEGHIMPDHVHMMLNVPPKLAVSSVVGYIKGKSAIHVAWHYLGRERNYAGQAIRARGYFVDTVGRDTELTRHYIAECRGSRKKREPTRKTKKLKQPALSGSNPQAPGFAGGR